MMTKIYVCEYYHDNAAGIFSTLDKALKCLDNQRGCEVREMELIDGEFEYTKMVPIAYITCANCHKSWRSDQQESIVWKYEDFCDERCRNETERFYGHGNHGIFGKSTREVIEYYAEKIRLQEDPYKGLVSTSSCPPSSMKIFTKQ